ncbi:MAG TPA: NifU family protein [Trueperaceae bacterium]
MLSFTETAKERVLHFLEVQKGQGVTALRVAGNRAEQKLWLVKPDDRRDDDAVFDGGGFEVFLDPLSRNNLEGARVDFVEGVMQSGFRVFYPSPTWDDPVAQKVQDVLDRQINPGVASHGGTVSLERVEEGVAYISLGGGCQGCGAADITLRQGIERMILEQVPEVTRVADVTDHASGTNPYYKREEDGADSPLA